MPRIDQPATARSRRSRQALLEAGRTILQEEGFAGLTMQAVADRAGLSRRGAYLHFASVAALVAELFDHIAEVEGLGQSMETIWQAPDAAAGLQAWAHHLADYHPRVMAVDRALQQVEDHHPAAADHRTRVSHTQEQICHRVAQWLAKEGRLAEGWTVATATDLLYGLISTDLINRLLHHRSWPQDQLAHRLAVMLHSTLVATHPPKPQS